MKPILFIIPEFGFKTYILLLIVSFIIFSSISIFLRSRILNKKKFKKEIAGYSILVIALITAVYIFAPVPIRTYGVAVALGFLCSLFVGIQISKRENIKPEYFLDLGVYVLIGTVLGARLFYFIFYDFEYFIQNPLKFFAVWEGGMVFYGGVVGAIFTGYYYVKKQKLNILKIADIVGIVVPLGLFFGRWGCFGYGCCFGKVAPQGFPLAIRFPAKHFYGYTPAFEYQLFEGMVKSTDKFSLPVYPTQLISSINGLILFLVLYILYKHKKFDGQIAAFSLMFYAITRFLIEFLRVNPIFLGLTVSQWIGIFMFISGLWLYRYSYTRNR